MNEAFACKPFRTIKVVTELLIVYDKKLRLKDSCERIACCVLPMFIYLAQNRGLIIFFVVGEKNSSILDIEFLFPRYSSLVPKGASDIQ